jgi:hypothetical protein
VALDVVGQGKFSSTLFPVVDIIRDTGAAGSSIYGGAKLERYTSSPTANGGIGFYFKYPDSAGNSTFAGIFGGALSTVTNGSEVGQIVIAASWQGADPSSKQHLVIKATGTDTGDVIIPNGNLELGHATDTTIARVSAGVISVEGVTVPTISSTNTLTNKRITPRVATATDDATAEIDCDATDQYQLTAIANNTTFTVAGTPTNGQKLLIRLKDAGTGKTLTWNAVFRAIGVTLPTTTVASKTHYIGCVYNSADSKWDVLAVGAEA